MWAQSQFLNYYFFEVFCYIRKQVYAVSNIKCNLKPSLGMIQVRVTPTSHHLQQWGWRVIIKYLSQGQVIII